MRPAVSLNEPQRRLREGGKARAGEPGSGGSCSQGGSELTDSSTTDTHRLGAAVNTLPKPAACPRRGHGVLRNTARRTGRAGGDKRPGAAGEGGAVLESSRPTPRAPFAHAHPTQPTRLTRGSRCGSGLGYRLPGAGTLEDDTRTLCDGSRSPE